jgi:hypothetical protein
MNPEIPVLESQLNAFSADERRAALLELLNLAKQGFIPIPPPGEVANMHSHTFFSYNGYGFSPTALAWLAKKEGYKLFGIVDFDVLDGVDEFLSACDLAGIRGSCGMETRVFIPEFADKEINSPGEPGIFYHMGIGFTSSQVPDTETEAKAILADMRARAYRRNRGVIQRVNEVLKPICLDYDQHVLPLTPSGNATERHMCAAYVQAVKDQVEDPVRFWSKKLQTSYETVAAIIDDGPVIQNLVRAKLMKRGGVGYVQPGPDTFPSLEEVNKVIISCGALPCATWLDGTSSGERKEEELLDLLIGKGIVALNIIPDRNWNISDPLEKELKLGELYKVVSLARELDLPINTGTEMNAFGKKTVDDFSAPELAPVRDDFLNGAYFIYGHTVMQRIAGLGYQSAWSRKYLPSRSEKNAFYSRIGRTVEPVKDKKMLLKAPLTPEQTPVQILEQIDQL